MPNRLTAETSPYLLQHKDNPVEWYPWGPEALERARAEDKPILLSIGYSACHWCHVMEHESFEDEDTARLMNEHFVNIKVDREERPDIDSIYMTAVQQMTGHGGWPLTAFLTPDGVPFYGGTYFPPEPRHGMPSFRQILAGVHDAYASRREQVEQSAAELHDLLQKNAALRAPPAELDSSILDRAFHTLAARFDARYGGLGGAPKFPQPLTLDFLLRQWKRTGSAEALRIVEQTLHRMAEGGIYDQVGGGFHRYSVDARWLVPHFEKMLYDNALLSRTYLHAYQATGEERFRQVAEETLRYVAREMRSPQGGFFSSQDADSEGEEGLFYIWTPEEIDAVLGERDGMLFRRFYGVTPEGNFEGKNILHVNRSVEAVAAATDATVAEVEAALERGRDALYAARAERVWPARDDKVLTAWNAMMLHSFAEAARVLGIAEYREIAVANAEFLLRELKQGDGLLRSYKDGTAKIDAFLEDYALLVDALLAVYEATWNGRWVREARDLADAMLQRFWDEDEGVFYDTPVGGEELVVRPRDLYDNPTPAGTSAATLALLHLSALVGEPEYARIAVRVLRGMGQLLAQMPGAFAHLLGALDFHLAPPREVAIIGDASAEDTQALLEVLDDRFLPNTTFAFARPENVEESSELIPLLEGRAMVNGRATAYVCERHACRQPVTEAAGLREELEEV